MSLRTRNKVSVAFSMSSMTDIVFLLLIFFMITSTLVFPNALKLLLPQSTNQTAARPNTIIQITNDLQFYIENKPVQFNEIESVLRERMKGQEDPTISLRADKSVPLEEVVKVMNIAKNNQYKLILATSPE